MLLLALVAKQFIGEPNWIGDLAQSGTLLIGIGVAVELAARKPPQAAYRAAVGLAIGTALLLGWVNGAVGIIGSADNQANLMYGGDPVGSQLSDPSRWNSGSAASWSPRLRFSAQQTDNRRHFGSSVAAR